LQALDPELRQALLDLPDQLLPPIERFADFAGRKSAFVDEKRQRLLGLFCRECER
jgi:hypothetical protein